MFELLEGVDLEGDDHEISRLLGQIYEDEDTPTIAFKDIAATKSAQSATPCVLPNKKRKGDNLSVQPPSKK